MSHSCPLLTVTALLVLLGFAPCRAHAAQDVKEPAQTQEEKFDSPRIAALWKEYKVGNHAALESFWQEMNGKTPLVELVPTSDRERSITFVWRGDEKTQRVTLLGDIPTTDVSQWQLRRLADTDLRRSDASLAVVLLPGRGAL